MQSDESTRGYCSNPTPMGSKYKFNMNCEGPLIGFCLESKRCTKEGELVKVSQRAFLTDNDDETFFYSCLDQISRLFLREWMIRERTNESSISNCLILMSNVNSAKVYINFPTIMNIIARRRINAGDPIAREDIADIREIVFSDPEIKDTDFQAIIYIFSIGWKRGLFYDFTSMTKGSSDALSINSIRTLLASFYAYIIFPVVILE